MSTTMPSRTRSSDAKDETDLHGTLKPHQPAPASRSPPPPPPPSSSTEEQNASASTSANATRVTVSESDVLLGRGRNIEWHEGNVRFHHRVEQHLRGYQVLRARPAKNRYTTKIVNQMKKSGIRFLKQSSEDSAWYEVDDETARMKVGQSLRYLRKRNSSDASHDRSQQSKGARSWAHGKRSRNQPGSDFPPKSSSQPASVKNNNDVGASSTKNPTVDESATSSDPGFFDPLDSDDWRVQSQPAGDGVRQSRKGSSLEVDDFFFFMSDVI